MNLPQHVPSAGNSARWVSVESGVGPSEDFWFLLMCHKPDVAWVVLQATNSELFAAAECIRSGGNPKMITADSAAQLATVAKLVCDRALVDALQAARRSLVQAALSTRRADVCTAPPRTAKW